MKNVYPLPLLHIIIFKIGMGSYLGASGVNIRRLESRNYLPLRVCSRSAETRSDADCSELRKSVPTGGGGSRDRVLLHWRGDRLRLRRQLPDAAGHLKICAQHRKGKALTYSRT